MHIALALSLNGAPLRLYSTPPRPYAAQDDQDEAYSQPGCDNLRNYLLKLLTKGLTLTIRYCLLVRNL